MKKKISLLVTLILIISMFSLAGCGGEKTEDDNKYSGKWVAVSAEMSGISIPVKEAFDGDFHFEVKAGGKVTFTVGDDSGDGKWSVKGDKFTLSIEGKDMVGTIGKDSINFKDMMEQGGLNVIFAKDGTDAMDPGLYLTEDEQKVLGKWMSENVKEVLDDAPKTKMKGVNNINDAMRLDFTNDRNVTVVYKGKEIGKFTWAVALGNCSIESENPSIYVDINDDGTLDVTYSDDEDYYTFHCVKAE